MYISVRNNPCESSAHPVSTAPLLPPATNQSINTARRSTPDIEHQPRALLEQLHLSRALNLGRAALGLAEDARERVLDLLRHVLRVTANVHVALAGEDCVGDLRAVVPDEVLHVDLGAVGPVHLPRERGVHRELSLQFVPVLGPFITVQEVLIVAPAAVEEREPAPVLERVRTILFDAAPRERDALLDKAAEGSNTLWMSGQPSTTNASQQGAERTVPGPIMMIGLFGFVGRRKVERRTWTGTL
jgi:hypothetical protein